jgi:hypothetical protein
LKIKKLTVHKFQNARHARTGGNMVKSSGPNFPSTWLNFLCPLTHAFLQNLTPFSVLAVRISPSVIAVFVFRKHLFTNKTLPYLFVTRISRYIYSVRYYPRFRVTAGGLGTYYLWVRGHNCIILFRILSLKKCISVCYQIAPRRYKIKRKIRPCTFRIFNTVQNTIQNVVKKFCSSHPHVFGASLAILSGIM